MPFAVLKGGSGQPVTLHLTSEPVTFPGSDQPVEVPEGYLAVLVDRKLTAPHTIVEWTPPAADVPDHEDDDTPPAAPKKGGRKHKEA